MNDTIVRKNIGSTNVAVEINGEPVVAKTKSESLGPAKVIRYQGRRHGMGEEQPEHWIWLIENMVG